MTLAQLKESRRQRQEEIVAGQDALVPLKGTAEPHLPDLPAPR